MTALLTNRELGIPENATPAERIVALAKTYEDHGILLQGSVNKQDHQKAGGEKHA